MQTTSYEKKPIPKVFTACVATDDFRIASTPVGKKLLPQALELTEAIAELKGWKVVVWEFSHIDKVVVMPTEPPDVLSRIKEWLQAYKPQYSVQEGN